MILSPQSLSRKINWKVTCFISSNLLILVSGLSGHYSASLSLTLYKQIFLADDDPEDREIFMDALLSIDESIQFFTAGDGEKAVAILDSDIFKKPDLIFLDMNMPFLTGKQVLEKIKNNDDLKNIPVIMYSTFFNTQDIAEFTALGAVHYLVKPTSFEVLLNSLRAVLSHKW